MAQISAQDWLDNRQLTGEVARLCALDLTGTLFCITEDGSSASLGIRDGAIVSLTFRNRHGREALSDIRAIGKSKIKFHSNVLLRIDQTLPAPDELLAFLSGPPATELPHRPPPALLEFQKVAEKQALELFGPVALVLCRDAFAQTRPQNMDDLRGMLKVIAAAAGVPHKASELIRGVFAQSGLDSRHGEDSAAATSAADRTQAASSKELHAIIEQALNAVFGPAPARLSQEAIKHAAMQTTSAELRQLLKVIAKEFGEADKVRHFIARVMRESGFDQRRGR